MDLFYARVGATRWQCCVGGRNTLVGLKLWSALMNTSVTLVRLGISREHMTPNHAFGGGTRVSLSHQRRGLEEQISQGPTRSWEHRS